MMLKLLFNACHVIDVKNILSRYKYVNVPNSIKVLQNLHHIEPVNVSMELFLVEDAESINAYGRSTKSHEIYSIELQPWNEWLGMSVPICIMDTYDVNTIVASCLRSMISISYNENEISLFRSELTKNIEHSDDSDGFINYLKRH